MNPQRRFLRRTQGSPLILAHGRVMRVFSPTFSPAAPAS